MRFIYLCTQCPFINIIICIFSITITKIKNQKSHSSSEKIFTVVSVSFLYLTVMGEGQGSGEGWGDEHGGIGGEAGVINRPVQRGQWKNDLCGSCELGGNCK